MTIYNQLTGKDLWHIITSHSMSIDEAISLIDVDWKDDGQGNLYYIDDDGDENYKEDIGIRGYGD